MIDRKTEENKALAQPDQTGTGVKKGKKHSALVIVILTALALLCFAAAFLLRARLSYRPTYVIESSSDVTFGQNGKTLVIDNGKETIVVDFKFAKPNEDHHQQVRKYVELLREMGLPNVRGQLWYVYSNKIEDVH